MIDSDPEPEPKDQAGVPSNPDSALLRAKERDFFQLLAQDPNPILLADRESLQFLAINEAAIRHYGFSAEEFCSMGLTSIRAADEVALLSSIEQSTNVDDPQPTPLLCALCATVRKYQKNESEFIEVGPRRHMKKDGSEILVELYAQATQFQERPAWLILVKDVTERKRQEEMIRHHAYYDVLTGLPNRILLKERITLSLAHAQRHHQRVAMLFLDLDRFKMINDTQGHHAGDDLLKEVSLRLSSCLRETDTVARLGGDEFLVLLPGIEQTEDVSRVAAKILDSFRHAFEIQNTSFHITTSIGISLFPQDGQDAQTLMKNADVALYCAKEHGRNNYQLYTPLMTVAALARVKLENNLRRAIEQQEFSLMYQPQYDLKSGNIFAIEALLRWEHEELGTIRPDEFIPVAEETGLIAPIWEWALKEGCRQLKRWKAITPSAPALSMNISSFQFQHADLVPFVANTLKETGNDPQDLILEITEGMALKADFAISLLRELKKTGLRISIDDFGTGYSSLGQLKRFPIDYLKIDPFFVHGLPEDANDCAIVRSIITLAHGLHLQTIAEGVETPEQLRSLRALNCDAIQGYLISRPVRPAQVERLLH